MCFSSQIPLLAHSAGDRPANSTSSLCENPSCICRVLRRAILKLDRMLRRSGGIFEYSGNNNCLLRIAATRARMAIALSDRIEVRPGDCVVDLHWWNERIARVLAKGSPLGRGKLLCRSLHTSFQALAEFASTSPELKDAKFFHARVVMPVGDHVGGLESVARRYGFNAATRPARGMERIHNFFEDFLVYALLWAFNPNPQLRKTRQLRRVDLWATRGEFLERYLGPAALSAAVRSEAGLGHAEPAGGRRNPGRAAARSAHTKLENVVA